jgi:hypothetical protein
MSGNEYLAQGRKGRQVKYDPFCATWRAWRDEEEPATDCSRKDAKGGKGGISLGISGLGGQRDQYAPELLKTAGIVFIRIFKSNPSDHLSM